MRKSIQIAVVVLCCLLLVSTASAQSIDLSGMINSLFGELSSRINELGGVVAIGAALALAFIIVSLLTLRIIHGIRNAS